MPELAESEVSGTLTDITGMQVSYNSAGSWRHVEAGLPANAGIDELNKQQHDHVEPARYGGLHNDRQPYHDRHRHHQLQMTPHKLLL